MPTIPKTTDQLSAAIMQWCLDNEDTDRDEIISIVDDVLAGMKPTLFEQLCASFNGCTTIATSRTTIQIHNGGVTYRVSPDSYGGLNLVLTDCGSPDCASDMEDLAGYAREVEEFFDDQEVERTFIRWSKLP